MVLLLSLSLPPTGLADERDADVSAALGSVDAEDAEAISPEADPIVCKRVKVTGSHMRKHVCHKRSEWRTMRENAQELMDRKLQNTGPTEG